MTRCVSDAVSAGYLLPLVSACILAGADASSATGLRLSLYLVPRGALLRAGPVQHVRVSASGAQLSRDGEGRAVEGRGMVGYSTQVHTDHDRRCTPCRWTQRQQPRPQGRMPFSPDLMTPLRDTTHLTAHTSRCTLWTGRIRDHGAGQCILEMSNPAHGPYHPKLNPKPNYHLNPYPDPNPMTLFLPRPLSFY